MAPEAVAEVARRYVPGTGPVAVERLGRGLVNESHRVMRDGRLFSLRMPAALPAPIGVDRAWECRVLAQASAAGIAPPIECCEPERGVLVARWQEGAALSAAEARLPATALRIAALARRVQALALPLGARVMRIADWIEQYRRARKGADPLRAEAERRLATLAALPSLPQVLCHSDLHRANLIATQRGLVLLDWEYAHVGEALWDIAGWASNSDLAPDEREVLLASYLARPATRAESDRFEQLGWLYDYVCWLWSEVYVASTQAADRLILERGHVLAARLAARAGGGAVELPAH